MEIIEVALHFDKHLASFIQILGPFSYIILFLILFAETGLVIAPFLPGDSLLFVAGTLAGAGHLNLAVLYFTLLLAAILGDSVNYWIGHKIGPKVFAREKSKLFKKEYLEKTREFYEKHGGKTIILARFMPLIRTFAPFVAGVGKMNYATFFTYNVVGAFLWVTGFTFAGYFFGGLPFFQENFHYLVLFIIAISLLPMVIEYLKYKRGLHLSKKQMSHATYSDVAETFKKENLDG